jgi:hypothetical protein
VDALPSLSPLPADWSEEANRKQIAKLFSQITSRSRSTVYVDFLGLVEVSRVGSQDSLCFGYENGTEALWTFLEQKKLSSVRTRRRVLFIAKVIWQ